jgi:hypothetical protein
MPPTYYDIVASELVDPAMEQLRILTAALALDSFTAGELAVHAGAKLNTVRALVQRREWFAPLDDDDLPRKPGRPARRYRIADPDTVRAHVREAQESVAFPIVADDVRTPDEDEELTIDSAERSLIRALHTDDLEDRRILAGIAERTAGRVIDSADGQRAARAHAVQAFTGLINASEAKRESALTGVAHALVAALGSGGALGGVISALLQVSVEYEQAPPIAVVTGNDERPEEVVAGLSSTGWANEPFDDSHLIWAPVWAQPLVRTPLLAGVMLCHLHDEPESDLHHAVDLCRAWRVPIMVAATHD